MKNNKKKKITTYGDARAIVNKCNIESCKSEQEEGNIVEDKGLYEEEKNLNENQKMKEKKKGREESPQ
jgi:hypothetical protein